MFQNFRLSMTWLHTWFGLVLGYVLMVVFFFGALAVFDREIDRWSMPHTRFQPQPMPSFDRVLLPALQAARPDAKALAEARAKGGAPAAEPKPRTWGVYGGYRDPMVTAWIEFEGPPAEAGHEHADEGLSTSLDIDPRSGAARPGNPQPIGSGWFYPLHFSLQLAWQDLGLWIVGLAALAMLAALVSGVVMHKRILREFFTFRPTKARLRSTLDLHNLTGVVALPFHFMLSLSGLVIFGSLYLPAADKVLAPQVQARTEADAARKGLADKPAGRPAALASVDAMVAQAESRWAARGMAGRTIGIQVTHVGDANAYVTVYRTNEDRVASIETTFFEGASGRLLYEEPALLPVNSVRSFLGGLHMIWFRHWSLHWLYFFGALAGCACIATGFVFFVEKRKLAHARRGAGGARWADALAVASVTGMAIAAAAMLLANRLLPAEVAERPAWESGAFWGAWLLALVHAAWCSAPVRTGRLSPAWAQQCRALAVLCVAAVLANWATTGDHLVRTLVSRYWPVAGVDLGLLAFAAGAAWAAWRLRRAGGAAAPNDDAAAAADGDEFDDASTTREAHHA